MVNFFEQFQTPKPLQENFFSQFHGPEEPVTSLDQLSGPVPQDKRFESPMSVGATQFERPEKQVRPGARTLSKYARSIVPAVTATAGGLIASPGGVPTPATVVGAGIGGAIGEEVVDQLDEFLGISERQPLMLELMESGLDYSKHTAYEAGGLGLFSGIGAGLRYVAKKLPKFPTIPLTRKGAEGKASEVIAAETNDFPWIAKNIEQARELELEIPGLKFSRGQLTNDPAVIKFERAAGKAPGEVAQKQLDQAAKNSEAIKKYLDLRKGKEGLGEVVEPLTKQKKAVETGVETAQKRLESEALELKKGPGVLQAGATIRGAAKEGKTAAKKETKRLFEDVPEFEIDATSILNKIDDLSKPYDEFENVAKNIPEVFERATGVLSATGKTTPKGLQGLRREATRALREAQNPMEPNEAIAARAGQLIGEIDEVLKRAGEIEKRTTVFHQTSQEAADKISKEGFKIKRGDSSQGDILPEGINTKGTDSFIQLSEAKTKQLAASIPKNIKTKEFHDRGRVEAFLSDNSDEFTELAIKQKEIDRVYGKKVDRLLEYESGMSDEAYKKNIDKTDLLLKEWKEKYNEVGNKAAKLGNKILIDMGYDAIHIKNDAGGLFGKASTDNTIILKESLIRPKTGKSGQAMHKGKIVYPEKLKKELAGIDKQLKADPQQAKEVVDVDKTYKELKDANVMGIMQLVKEGKKDYSSRLQKSFKINFGKDAPIEPMAEKVSVKIAKARKAEIEKILSESTDIKTAEIEATAGKLRAAQQFYKKEVVGKFKAGSVGAVLKKIRGGDKVSNAQVVSKFFKPGGVGEESAQEFMNAVGGNQAATEAMESAVKQDLFKAAYNPVKQEIVESKLKAWLSKYDGALKTLGIKDKFNSVLKARKELDTALDLKTQFDKSVASKLIKADVDEAVKKAFSAGSKKTNAEALLKQMKGNKQAISGLQNSMIDHIIKKAETTAIDAFDNPIISMAGFERGFRKYLPAINEVFKDSPQKLKAFENYRTALKTLQRNKKDPIGGGSDSFSLIATHIAKVSGLAHWKIVSIVKSMLGPIKDMSDKQVNALLNRAAFDPDFAFTLAGGAKGMPIDVFERRLWGHLAAMGMRSTKKPAEGN